MSNAVGKMSMQLCSNAKQNAYRTVEVYEGISGDQQGKLLGCQLGVSEGQQG